MQAPSGINDTHYIRTVTRLGDRHSIIANQDICNTKGLKLVAKGTAINSHLFEKLILHKLAPPLDQCLNIDNAVNNDEIILALVWVKLKEIPHQSADADSFSREKPVKILPLVGRVRSETPLGAEEAQREG